MRAVRALDRVSGEPIASAGRANQIMIAANATSNISAYPGQKWDGWPMRSL